MKPATPVEMQRFKKQAMSITWRMSAKTEHSDYFKFRERIKELQDTGLKSMQATVQAAKEFKYLHQLFRMFNVGDYDPYPESFPVADSFRNKNDTNTVESEGIDQSYKANLSWAMAAAGEHFRTGREPTSCPNDKAYFLYIQAKENPKEFLNRSGQAERDFDDDEDGRELRKMTMRSIKEIEEMLNYIESEVEENEKIS